MVEYTSHNAVGNSRRSDARLNAIFHSLSDPTRRDILRRLSRRQLFVGELATSYELTFAAISKHLTVLEKAELVHKKRKGRTQLVALSPPALKTAAHYLEKYREIWEDRLDRLEEYIKENP